MSAYLSRNNILILISALPMWLIIQTGCNRPQEVHFFNEQEEGHLVTKHCFRTATKDNWKVETWLNASLERVGGSLKLFVRLHPQKANMEKPDVKLQLQVTGEKTGELMNNTGIRLDLLDCREMKKQRETIKGK